VASSSANQKVVTVCGSVTKKLASWCQPTSPPMPGCLKITMRLPDLRLHQAQVGGQRGQRRAVREGVEHRVQVVQSRGRSC
jgi:hypothetical protein